MAGSPTDERGAPGPPGSEPPEGEPDDIVIESPGISEVVVVPWAQMLRQRVSARAESHDKYPWIVLTAALFGLFTVGFSITVLNIAIPTIAAELGSSKSTLIWIITGPILLGAVVTPAAGKLADIFGARRIYLWAMAAVTLSAGLSAISWSAPSLLTFRIIGAAIGAATGPASVAIINRLFTRERRAQALGYWSLVAAGGPVVGVVVGGPVVEHVSWRWIFAAQVPLALMTLVICALIFPETPRSRGTKFDLGGALLLAAGAGSIVLALNRAPGDDGLGWTHPFVLGGFIAGPLLLVVFARHERRIPHQLIPTKYFPKRNFSLPLCNLFFANFAYMGGFFLTPFLLEDVLHYSAAQTGFVSIARPLTFAIAGPLAGWLATRTGERRNGVVGGLLIAASMLVFCSIGTSTSELVVIVALALSGAGMGATAPAMAAAIANAVQSRDLGVAGGAEQMFSSLGVVVGTQVMVTVQQAASAGGTASYTSGYLVGGVAGLVAAGAAAFVIPSVGRTVKRRGRAPADEVVSRDHAALVEAS
jgi:EmrB/QacA subfamily drug resistance transporter